MSYTSQIVTNKNNGQTDVPRKILV